MYQIKCNAIKNPEGMVVGMGSITVDDKFRIDSIKLIRKEDGTFFMGMPSFPVQKEYVEYFFPTKAEFRKELTDAFVKSFETGEMIKLREGKEEKIRVYVEADDIYAKTGKVTVSISKKESTGEKNTDFLIPSVKVVSGANGSFVSMPRRKDKDGEYRDICYPVTKEYREELYGTIMTRLKGLEKTPKEETVETKKEIDEPAEPEEKKERQEKEGTEKKKKSDEAPKKDKRTVR